VTLVSRLARGPRARNFEVAEIAKADQAQLVKRLAIMRGVILAVGLLWVGLLCACGTPSSAPDALSSCWSLDCPSDPGAHLCGTCKHGDIECPPGYVCDCLRECAKGPRLPDGGPACLGIDASSNPVDADLSPDAQHYDWSGCDPGSGANLPP
jgi:hypothetical protein